MKKRFFILFTALAIMGTAVQSEAAVVTIGGPGIVLANRQPVQAVIVGPNGNSIQQTVYFDPALGGVNLDTSWAGPNASVYFPAYQTSYIWYNGFWVDQAGAYWDGGKRVYITHPHWHDYWGGYWHNHWHEGWRSGWHPHAEVSVNFHGHGHHHYR